MGGKPWDSLGSLWHFSAFHTALVLEAPASPQHHCCPQPVHFTEMSFLLVELELRKQREHSVPDLWQSLTRVAAPLPPPQSSIWEAEVLTLPWNLHEHKSQVKGDGARAGNDSAPTHSSALPQLPAGAAETTQRELPLPVLGQSGEQPPEQGMPPGP